MQAFHLTDPNDFMRKLLTTDLFGSFRVSEATVTTFTTFHIDGTWQTAYFDEAPEEEALPWLMLQPKIRDLIKGRTLPLQMAFVLRLAPANVEKLIRQAGISISSDDIAGLFINLQYQRGKLTCVTGSSLKIFLPDKTLDHVWDDMVSRLLRQQNIPYEIL